MTQERLSRRQFFARSAAVIGTGVLVSELLAACGEVKGEAKANTLPTAPAVTRGPEATAKPELSLEEKLLISTEVRSPAEIQRVSDSVFNFIASRVSATDTTLVNARNDLKNALDPANPNINDSTELGINTKINLLGNSALALGRLYCRLDNDIRILAAWVNIRNLAFREAENGINKRVFPSTYKGDIEKAFFSIPCKLPGK